MALLTLNLRAVGEYATYVGFDVSSQRERLFALNVLGLSSSANTTANGVAMAHLVKIAQDVAKKRTWKQLEQHTLVQLIQPLAKSLGIRLTKAKLAQLVPVAGAVVGSGFNAYFTDKVCNAAYYLYRERFLAAKYGPDVIEETVKPARNFSRTTRKKKNLSRKAPNVTAASPTIPSVSASIELPESVTRMTQCMVRPCVASGFRRTGGERSCINVSGL